MADINDLQEQLDILKETKQNIKQAIVNKGKEITDNDNFGSYADKVNSIVTLGEGTADATATSSDIISSKTAYVNGEKVTGTIPVYSSLDTSIMEALGYTPSTLVLEEQGVDGKTYKTISFYDYTDENDISAFDSNAQIKLGLLQSTVANEIGLTADKIVKGNTILTVEGTADTSGLDTSDATATADDIIKNKTAYVNGEKVKGTLADYSNELLGISMPETDPYLDYCIKFPSTVENGKINSGSWFRTNVNAIAEFGGITADKIVEGNTIYGVEGTAKTSAVEDSNIHLFDSVESMNADTSCKEGDIGVVLKITKVPFTEQTNFQYLYLPNKIEVPSGASGMSITVDDGNSSYMPCYIDPAQGYMYTIYMGGSETEYDEYIYTITSNSDGSKTGVRKSNYNSIFKVPWGTNWKPKTVLDTETLYGIYGLNLEFNGIYNYDGTVWTYQPIGTTAYASSVINGKTFYTNSGMKTGTLHTEYYKQMTIDDNTSYDTFKQIVQTQATMRHINLNITKKSFDDTWKTIELRDIYNGDMMTSCGDLSVNVGNGVTLPDGGLFTCASSMQYDFNTIKLSGYDITNVLKTSYSNIYVDYYIVNSYAKNIVIKPLETYKFNIFILNYSCELQANTVGSNVGQEQVLTKTELLMLIDKASSNTGANDVKQTLTLPSSWYSLCTADEWKVLTDKNWEIVQK